MNQAASVASWWTYVARHEARELWRSLPGPWWAKALLIVVCAAIPGPQDELILLAIVAYFRKRQARKVKIGSDEKSGPAALTVELSTIPILAGQRPEGR